MHVWILKDGESLPTLPESKPMRVWLLGRALASRSHTVTWWTSEFSHQRKRRALDPGTYPVEPGLTLHVLPGKGYTTSVSLRRIAHHRSLARSFVQAATQLPVPDLIVAAFPIPELVAAATQLANTWRVPVVVDIRDVWPDALFSRLRPRTAALARLGMAPVYWRLRSSFKNATALTAVSEGYLRWGLQLAERAERKTDAVFYLGCPDQPRDDVALSTAASQFQPFAGRALVTYVGSFGRSYDLSTVVEAAGRLWRKGHRDIQFAIAGDGKEAATLRAMASGSPNITFTGWISGADAAALLRLSSIGVVPCSSAPHTLPNKLFEYMAFGLSIVSSLNGEAAELIRKHEIGRSYAVGDSEGLAAHIAELTSSPDTLARQRNRSRTLYEERFRAEDIYARYAAHLEQFAAR